MNTTQVPLGLQPVGPDEIDLLAKHNATTVLERFIERSQPKALGTFDGYDYERGRHFVRRSPVGEHRWEMFCGADLIPDGCDVEEAIRVQIRLAEITAPASDDVATSAQSIDVAKLQEYTTAVAAIAQAIKNNPERFALRFLNLEMFVRDQYKTIAGLQTRLDSLRGAIR